MKIEAVHWDGDEYVITFDGNIVGPTLSKHDAEIIVGWITYPDSIKSIQKLISQAGELDNQ
jgi:hypothetical protein